MYQIDRTPFGFKIIFQGFIQENELKRWAKEAKEMLDAQKEGFGVLLDMRGMAPLPVEAGEFMRLNQTAAKAKGMGRSAQVLDDPITTMQFKRIARESGILDDMRQIDASQVEDWEKAAIAWITMGVEPDM